MDLPHVMADLTDKIPLLDLYRIAEEPNSDDEYYLNELDRRAAKIGPPMANAIQFAISKYTVDLLLIELAAYSSVNGEDRSFVSLFASTDEKLLGAYKMEVTRNITADSSTEVRTRAPLVVDPRFYDLPVYTSLKSLRLGSCDGVAKFGSFSIARYGEEDTVRLDSQPTSHFEAFALALFEHLGLGEKPELKERDIAVLAIPFPRANPRTISGKIDLSSASSGGVLFIIAKGEKDTNWVEIAFRLFHHLVKMICLEGLTAYLESKPFALEKTVNACLWSPDKAEWFSDAPERADLMRPSHDLEQCTLDQRKMVWDLLNELFQAGAGLRSAEIPPAWGSRENGITCPVVYSALKRLLGCDADCQPDLPNSPSPGGKRPTLNSIAILAIAILNIAPQNATEALLPQKSPSLVSDKIRVSRKDIQKAVEKLILIFSIISRAHTESGAGTRPTVKKLLQPEGKNLLLIHLDGFDPNALLKKFSPDALDPQNGISPRGNLTDAIYIFQRHANWVEAPSGVHHPYHDEIEVVKGHQVTCSFNIHAVKDAPNECVMCIAVHKFS